LAQRNVRQIQLLHAGTTTLTAAMSGVTRRIAADSSAAMAHAPRSARMNVQVSAVVNVNWTASCSVMNMTTMDALSGVPSCIAAKIRFAATVSAQLNVLRDAPFRVPASVRSIQ
jgi:hypothetical protein